MGTFQTDEYFAPPIDWRSLKYSGEIILINFVHDADLLQYLLGPIMCVHAEKVASQRGTGHKVDQGAALML